MPLFLVDLFENLSLNCELSINVSKYLLSRWRIKVCVYAAEIEVASGPSLSHHIKA